MLLVGTIPLSSAPGSASNTTTSRASAAETGPGPGVSAPVTPFIFDKDLRTLPIAQQTPGPAREIDGPEQQEGATSTPTPPPPSIGSAGQEAAHAPVALAGLFRRPSHRALAATPNALSAPDPNFEGISNLNAVLPPDTNGDVGPNNYIQQVNSSFAVYGKSGNLLAGPSNNNSLWSGFGTICETNNNGDGIVRHDPLADRWVISQFAFNTKTDANGNTVKVAPYHECIAVSRGSNPVTGGWYLYDFTVSNAKFDDYPKLGVWPDGYYATFNWNGCCGTGVGAFAFDRTKMLSGNAASFICFGCDGDSYAALPSDDNILPSDLDGTTAPPAGAPDYLARFSGSDMLKIWQFHVDWGTPSNSTLTGPTNLTVNTFNSTLPGVPQPAITETLQTLSDRLMNRLQYRNFGSYETLVANHSIDVDGTNHAGVRWYELRKSGGGWSVYQQGNVAPDSASRWMGSIAMDNAGNIAVGYSVASSSLDPSIRASGRLSTDPLGTMPQGELSIIAGTGVQENLKERWGDYSSMNIDPADGCTFWFTTEYIATTVPDPYANWQTRIGAFRFTPTCKHRTTLTYTGDVTGDYHDVATLSATLVDAEASPASPPPIAGVTLTFQLGTQFCSAATDATGLGTCTIVLGQQSGPYTVQVSFAGGGLYLASTTSSPFTITQEQTALTYTGDTHIVPLGTGSFSAVLLEDATVPIATRTVTFTLSGQNCAGATDASGTARCSISPVTASLGFHTVTATFAGDAYYLPSTDSKTVLLSCTMTSGRGYGASAAGTLVADTGPLPATGGLRKGFAGVVNLSGPGYTLQAPTVPGAAALAQTSGQIAGFSASVSSIGTMLNFRLRLTGSATPVVISAGTVQATANDTCANYPSGATLTTGLTVNRTPVRAVLARSPSSAVVNPTAVQNSSIAVTTSPQGVVSIMINGVLPSAPIIYPWGTIVLNEQIVTPLSIVVNAIHIHTNSGQDFIFGSAQADLG
jgi:hypothetical protein